MDLTKECEEQLTGDWNKIVDTKPNQRKKPIENLKKSHFYKKQEIDATEVITDGLGKMKEMEEAIESGHLIASRTAINGSHFIPAKKHSGRITNIVSPFNFSVGHPGHTSYFASTFEGKTILIEFFLDKEAWAKWKINFSGPQISKLGPSSQTKLMTMNDVNKAGVKYEIADRVKEFFDEVIVKEIPAIVTPLGKVNYQPDIETVKIDIIRLKKAHIKLDTLVSGLIDKYSGEIGPEIAQFKLAGKVLEEEASTKEEYLADLYTSINLTKNALHSIRRKSATFK
jgi:hypothetical protein